jgi:hypothetical protein
VGRGEGCFEYRVIVVSLVVISGGVSCKVSCVDETVAEQEIIGLLCGDVPVCGHPSNEAPDRVFGGEVLRHAGTRVVQGVVISIGNGFGLAGVFSGVFEPRVLASGERCLPEPDSASSST